MFERIFISAGHGKKGVLNDPGSTTDNTETPQLGDKATERAITAACARVVLNALGTRAIAVGVDVELSLEDKIAKINQICKDRKYTVKDTLLVEIHVDFEGAPSGFGAYFFTGNEESKSFAKKIIDTMAMRLPPRKALWLRADSQSNYGSLGIIKNTVPLACLVEIGAMKADLPTLHGDKVKDEGEAIAEGIRSFAGWPTTVPITPDPRIKEAMDLISSAWHDFESMKTMALSGQEKLNQANTILRSL